VSRCIYYYAECRYAECRYAECCYAECRYAECRYAECRYAECRGVLSQKSKMTYQVLSFKMIILFYNDLFNIRKNFFLETS
jgi:hypothetical protein